MVDLCETEISPRLCERSVPRSEEHTSELQSQSNLVCRLLLEKKNIIKATLHQARGNRTYAARSLGLQRTYLLRLIRELRGSVPLPHPGHHKERSAAVEHAAAT